MTTPIDLSRLSRPEVPGLVLSVDEAHAEILAWLSAEHGWVVTQVASDPAWRLTRLLAAREALLRQAVADALAQGSLAYAEKENLDHIGATYYALARLSNESDDRYRERLAASFERYAVGLSGQWYESIARAVDGVADARVTTPAPGTVRIFILADETLENAAGEALYANGIPTQALLDAVTAVVTADDSRQQTDTVEVRACTRQRYDVAVTLTLLAEPDSATVIAAAESGLAQLATRAARLGGSISEALIAGATVTAAAVRSAVIQLQTVDGGGNTAPVAAIAAADSVAPQARTLTVTAA